MRQTGFDSNNSVCRIGSSRRRSSSGASGVANRQAAACTWAHASGLRNRSPSFMFAETHPPFHFPGPKTHSTNSRRRSAAAARIASIAGTGRRTDSSCRSIQRRAPSPPGTADPSSASHSHPAPIRTQPARPARSPRRWRPTHLRARYAVPRRTARTGSSASHRSRSAARSAAEPYRSAGAFSRHWRTIASRSAGTSRRSRRGGTGSAVWTCWSVCTTPSPTNGGRPVSRW